MPESCNCFYLGKQINFYNVKCPLLEHRIEYYKNELKQLKHHIDLVLREIQIFRDEKSHVH